MRNFLLSVLLASAALPCFAADSPWNGTWKLNRDKSQMTGTILTFTQTGNMYTIDTGGYKYSFACDGKVYPALADRTMTCIQNGNVYTTTHMVKGKTTATVTHTLSGDGNTVSDVTSGTRPDGTSYTETSTSQRVGEGKGLVGTWKETEVKSAAPESIVLTVTGDTLRWEDPGYKETSETRLDGTPGPISGPEIPSGMMVSTLAQGSNKVVSTLTLNGKDFAKDEMTLSDDGATITDVEWTPGKESEKRTYVYDKQ
jgi:hypothetical protein